MTTTTTESYRQRQTREKREAKAWWGKPIKVKANDGSDDDRLYYEREHEGHVFRTTLIPRSYRTDRGYTVSQVAPVAPTGGTITIQRASSLDEAQKAVRRYLLNLRDRAAERAARDAIGVEQGRFIEGLGGLAAARKEHALLEQQANEAGIAYHDAAKLYNERCASLRTLAEAIAHVESTRLDTATIPT